MPFITEDTVSIVATVQFILFRKMLADYFGQECEIRKTF